MLGGRHGVLATADAAQLGKALEAKPQRVLASNVAGAKVQAMTILDLLTKPELVQGAWDYFNNVQTKDVKYVPFITRDTPPPTHLNKAILEKYNIAEGAVTAADVQAIRDQVKRDLAAYKYPRLVEFVQSFPLTSSGKIRRAELRRLEVERVRGLSANAAVPP